MKTALSFLCLFIFICTNTTQAQKVALSVGIEKSFPLNIKHDEYYTAKDYFKNGLGPSIKVEIPILKKLYLTGSLGYVSYASKQNYLSYVPGIAVSPVLQASVIPQTSSLSPLIDYVVLTKDPRPFQYIPIKIGLRVYPIKYLYAEGEAGIAIKLNYASKNSFLYAGGVGGVLPLDANNSIDIGVRFEGNYRITDYYYIYPMQQLAVRAAYRYRF